MSAVDVALLLTPLVAVALGVALPWRVSGPLLVALVVVVQLALHAATGEAVDVPGLLVTISPWLVGCAIRSRRQLTAALAERAAELERERDLHAALAARQERARIARELHDIVAHHLAVIAVQAGAGRLAAHPQPADVVETFANVRVSAERALGELDVLLDVLHADGARDVSLGPRLAEALDGARAAGLHVQAAVPPCDHLPATVADTAYRVVQEGLTNAVKHAPGSAVDVEVAIAEGRLRLSVRNAGRRGAGTLASTGSGLGLRGLGERVAALGGELAAGPVEDGWEVCAQLPLRIPAPVEVS